MLLDVRFLIGFLRSQAWAWTTAAAEWLFSALELRDLSGERTAPRRELRNQAGLVCVLYSDAATRTPDRLEFLFPVPQPLSMPEEGRAYLDFSAVALRAVLGDPAFEGSPGDAGFPAGSSASYRLHWVEPKARIAMELRLPRNGGASLVALAIEKVDAA